jgi:uncharacterized coiled-coil protein SlyX
VVITRTTRFNNATDEKQRLEACEAAWERQIEELKAKVAELEAALERKRDHD